MKITNITSKETINTVSILEDILETGATSAPDMEFEFEGLWCQIENGELSLSRDGEAIDLDDAHLEDLLYGVPQEDNITVINSMLNSIHKQWADVEDFGGCTYEKCEIDEMEELLDTCE